MKRFVAILFSVALFMTIAGCSVEKVDDSKGSTGGTITDASDSPTVGVTDAADIPTSVPTATPTEKPVLATVPWGDDDYTKLLPECTLGAVTLITPGEKGCLVVVEQVDDDIVKSYTDKLVEAGFECVDGNADIHTEGHDYSNSNISVEIVYASGIMTLIIQK